MTIRREALHSAEAMSLHHGKNVAKLAGFIRALDARGCIPDDLAVKAQELTLEYGEYEGDESLESLPGEEMKL